MDSAHAHSGVRFQQAACALKSVQHSRTQNCQCDTVSLPAVGPCCNVSRTTWLQQHWNMMTCYWSGYAAPLYFQGGCSAIIIVIVWAWSVSKTVGGTWHSNGREVRGLSDELMPIIHSCSYCQLREAHIVFVMSITIHIVVFPSLSTGSHLKQQVFYIEKKPNSFSHAILQES